MELLENVNPLRGPIALSGVHSGSRGWAVAADVAHSVSVGFGE